MLSDNGADSLTSNIRIHSQRRMRFYVLLNLTHSFQCYIADSYIHRGP